MPDGLDDFVDHNLMTFKSHQEPLNDWTLKELTGHYVSYRKEVSPRNTLLPESVFRLYAVCARSPRDLFDTVSAQPLRSGVYQCRRGSDIIRVIVVAELPLTESNALLHLFSAAADRVKYGAEHYRIHEPDLSTVVNTLFEAYRQEGLAMPYTVSDYRKEVVRKVLSQLSLEDRLEGFSREQNEAYLRRLRKTSPAPRKRKPKPKH